MNAILFFILLLIIAGYLLEQILGILNYRAGKREVPEILADVYDKDRYRKYLAYKQVSFKFGMLTSFLSFLLILFMVLRGFVILDDYVSQITNNQIIRGLLFFGIIGALSDLLFTPFSLYDTFVIEQKYGFNTTTLKTFLLDKLKTYGLAVVFGGGMLSLFIWVYQLTGNHFWWIALAAIVGVLAFHGHVLFYPYCSAFQ